MVYNIYNKIL